MKEPSSKPPETMSRAQNMRSCVPVYLREIYPRGYQLRIPHNIKLFATYVLKTKLQNRFSKTSKEAQQNKYTHLRENVFPNDVCIAE
jgi:hypothetical protein